MALTSKLLAFPGAYRTFVRLIGGNYRVKYLRDYVCPVENERVLDVGCGPGDVLDYLPNVRYLGLDISPEYISAAKQRFGDRGEFICRDVSDLGHQEACSFDLVMANGLLHHLDDAQGKRLLDSVRRVLKPEGRLVTFDGCWVTGQSRLARYLLGKDRGRFVRDEAGYLALTQPFFAEIRSHIRHDFLWLPYTHIIMVCRKPIAS